MELKNPYALIKKTSSSVDLCLEKYETIEDSLNQYKAEQEKTNELLSSFMEYHKKDQSELIKLLENEISSNKKMFKELEIQLDSAHDMNSDNYKKCYGVYKSIIS